MRGLVDNDVNVDNNDNMTEANKIQIESSLNDAAQRPIPAKGSKRIESIVWMLVSVFFFAVFDAITKYLSGSYSPFFLIWSRYFVHTTIAVLLFFPKNGMAVFETKRLGAQVIRGLLMFGVSLCMMNGAKHIPLAELTALYFTAPLIATAATPILLKEKIGKRSWIAVGLGFTGVLIIAKPSDGDVNSMMLLPLTAAALYAGFQIFTRNFSKTESPITTNIMTGMVGAIAMTLALPFLWKEWLVPTLPHMLFILGLGLSGFLAQFMLIKALGGGNPAELAPFSYTQLIWASVIGFVIFEATPKVGTLIGMVVIAAGGMYEIWNKKTNRLA